MTSSLHVHQFGFKAVEVRGLLVGCEIAMPRMRARTSYEKDDVCTQERVLDRLKQEEGRLRRQRRALQDKERRQESFVADVAFILFVWTCPDPLLCHAYLAHRQVRSGARGCSVAEIEDRYLSTTIDHINAIHARNDHIGKRKIATAERYLREFRLARWIDAKNANKGNAPTVALVQQMLARSSDDAEQAGKVNAAETHARVSTKWVQRFRQKWGFTRGRFSARDRIPVAELRDKALHSMSGNLNSNEGRGEKM